MSIELFSQILLSAAVGMLALALALVTFRLLRGPNTLDRMVSLDTFSAVLQCGIGVYITWTVDTTPAAVMVALALVAFIGSVAVARYRVPDDTGGSSRAPTPTTDSRPRPGSMPQERGSLS